MTELLAFGRSRERVAAGARYLAGGVSSNYRLGISPTPLVIERGDGAYLYDVDGNQLIDYYLGMGPIIIGHNPPEIVAAVIEQAARGFLYAGQTELEYQAAQLICEMVPCAERIRFGLSGTEMVQAAMRLARAATGRKTIIKFEGHYHGWLDNILWSVSPPPDKFGPDNEPIPQPGSAGIDEAAGAHLEVMAWNHYDWLVQRLKRGDVAAVIMEPIMCNTSAILPDEGYLESVRQVCDATGTILIFDEVITGFRVAAGGASARLGVTPDLAIFGKAIANGFPVACLAGRADLMDRFVSGGVMHGGTYNAQTVSMAATVVTLERLRQPGFYEMLEARGRRLMDGITQRLEAAGLTARVQGLPQIFHVAFGVDQPIRHYRDSLAADRSRYVRFTTALLQRGVRALERGAWFISAAHNDAIIDETLAQVGDALAAVSD